jgi:elongation factor G
VEKGVRQVMLEGCVAGYPMQDIRVCVYDGKHHPVDSKEVAFVTAAGRAFQDAIHKAGPALLEPIVKLEITAPNECMGDITGELSSKRGRVIGTDMLGADMSLITAEAPLAELATFQNHLRSITGGQGSFTVEPDHYEPMPAHEQQKIVAQYQPKAEED